MSDTATITSSDAPAGAAAVPPAASAAPAPPAASSPAGGAPNDWRATLPADLREAPSLTKFADPAALAKGYVEAEKLISRKGAVVPKEGDPPEVLAAWRAALGVPEGADGYTLKAPDGLPPAAWNDEGAKTYATWAHELGLTPQQAQGLAERFARQQGEAMQRAAEGIGPDGRKMEDVLREEWGASYDGKVEAAKRAAKQFGADEGVLDALEAKVGGAALTRLFAKIGEAIGEDQVAGLGNGQSGRQPPQAELSELMKLDSPYWKPMHPAHRDTVARVTELHRIMAGSR